MVDKTGVIAIRLENKVIDIIERFCNELSISRGEFIKLVLADAIIKAQFNKELTEELKRYISIYTLRDNRRKMSNRMYIKKNMYQRVMDMAMSDYFIIGYINMKVIKELIDSFVQEFNHYPKKERELIEDDFKFAVKQLRSEDYILNHMSSIKLLKDRRK